MRSPLLAFHLERRLLLSDTVAGMRWGGEIWHTREESLSIRPASRHPVPPHRWQASRRITLPPPVIRAVVLSFVCADKRGPERAQGGQCLAWAVSNEPESVAVIINGRRWHFSFDFRYFYFFLLLYHVIFDFLLNADSVLTFKTKSCSLLYSRMASSTSQLTLCLMTVGQYEPVRGV